MSPPLPTSIDFRCRFCEERIPDDALQHLKTLRFPYHLECQEKWLELIKIAGSFSLEGLCEESLDYMAIRNAITEYTLGKVRKKISVPFNQYDEENGSLKKMMQRAHDKAVGKILFQVAEGKDPLDIECAMYARNFPS